MLLCYSTNIMRSLHLVELLVLQQERRRRRQTRCTSLSLLFSLPYPRSQASAKLQSSLTSYSANVAVWYKSRISSSLDPRPFGPRAARRVWGPDYISSASLSSIRYSAKLPLGAGLIRATWAHRYSCVYIARMTMSPTLSGSSALQRVKLSALVMR